MKEGANVYAGVLRILVTGPRSGIPADFVRQALEENPFLPAVVLHGGAHGVDEVAADWFDCRSVAALEIPAEWDKHGLAAGPIRNQKMVNEAEGAIAIVPDWPTRGTSDCIARVLRKRIPLWIRRYHGPRVD